MNQKLYHFALVTTAILFVAIFSYNVFPALLENFDIKAAIMGGFVNPFASSYAMDAVLCWVVLALWVIYERKQFRNGWIALLLGMVPGVVVGFAFYLITRERQLKQNKINVNESI